MAHQRKPAMNTIFIVDNDLGLAMWLANKLYQLGYAAFPTTSVPNAKILLNELKIRVDLLIVNAALPGAASLAETLRGLHQRLKVVVITDSPVELDQIPDVDLHLRKPERWDESVREDLIAQIVTILRPFPAN
jgi:DNA-binding response OmpR family regulator